MGKWDKYPLWDLEQEETGRATGRLPEGYRNAVTMAWTQEVAVETEGKESRSKKMFRETNNVIK